MPSLRGSSTGGAPSQHIPGSVPEYPWVRKGSLPDVNGAFEALRPGLAMHFPFELDTFQKEAVVSQQFLAQLQQGINQNVCFVCFMQLCFILQIDAVAITTPCQM